MVAHKLGETYYRQHLLTPPYFFVYKNSSVRDDSQNRSVEFKKGGKYPHTPVCGHMCASEEVCSAMYLGELYWGLSRDRLCEASTLCKQNGSNGDNNNNTQYLYSALSLIFLNVFFLSFKTQGCTYIETT